MLALGNSLLALAGLAAASATDGVYVSLCDDNRLELDYYSNFFTGSQNFEQPTSAVYTEGVDFSGFENIVEGSGYCWAPDPSDNCRSCMSVINIALSVPDYVVVGEVTNCYGSDWVCNKDTERHLYTRNGVNCYAWFYCY